MLRLLRLAALLSALVLAGTARAEERGAAADQARLFVELVLNGEAKGAIVAMTLRDGHPIVDAGELTAAGLSLDRTGPVDLAATPQVRAAYDAANQRLQVEAAPALLPTRRIAAPTRERVDAVTSTGAMLNYTLYVQHGAGTTSASLWSEQRLFGALGTFSNSGTLIASGGAAANVVYRRYDTRFHYVNADHAFVVTAGDLITRSLPWTSSVRMAGLQLARDFRVRPDLLTMPLPSFAGETAVPTAVDLFVNGFRQQRAEVAPGRFVLDRMPVVNGAGEASIVTTDAVGRQIVTSIPFYVASDLLRPGLLDGGVEVGALRRNYGLRNFDYGPAAAGATMRYGVSPRVTIQAHAEATSHLALAGGGINWSPGRMGVIDLAVSGSRMHDASGRQLTIGYSYVSRIFTFSAQHIERSAEYFDLGLLGTSRDGVTRAANRVVASASLSRYGAVGVAYVSGVTARAGPTRLASFSYSKTLARRASLFASVDHDFVTRSTSAQLRLSISFGRSSVSGGLSYDPGRHAVGQIDYLRTMPSSGGLGLSANLGGGAGGAVYGQASAQWRNRLVEVDAGGAVADGRGSVWGSASGTLVTLDRRVFLANQVADAFAVVSSDGVGGVPISYENQFAGVTDRHGYLFVPSISSYNAVRFALDPLALDADYAAPVVEKRLAFTSGVGAVVHMPVHHSRSMLVSLVDDRGQPLAAGAVAGRLGKASVRIGWDGLAFLEDAQPSEELRVRRSDGGSCRARVVVPPALRSLSTIGPVPCV